MKSESKDNSLYTTDARLRRVSVVHRRRGLAGTRSSAAIFRFVPMGPTVLFGHGTRTQRSISAVFMHRVALSSLPVPSVALLCVPTHGTAVHSVAP